MSRLPGDPVTPNLIAGFWADDLLRAMQIMNGQPPTGSPELRRYREEREWLKQRMAEDFLPDTLDWLLPMVLERWSHL